jgi:hypothetical protein
MDPCDIDVISCRAVVAGLPRALFQDKIILNRFRLAGKTNSIRYAMMYRKGHVINENIKTNLPFEWLILRTPPSKRRRAVAEARNRQATLRRNLVKNFDRL